MKYLIHYYYYRVSHGVVFSSIYQTRILNIINVLLYAPVRVLIHTWITKYSITTILPLNLTKISNNKLSLKIGLP